jgi:flagellar motility protein MotE (MotC chaperone)
MKRQKFPSIRFALLLALCTGGGLTANSESAPTARGPEETSRFGAPDPSAVPAPAVAADPVIAKKESACLADEAAVQDIRRRREELEAREKQFALRESEIKARERAVEEQLKKLEDARAEIATTETLKSRESEEKIAKLVETLETMSPKAASQMVTVLDEQLAVAAMSRMATPKLAKIMNVLEPAKSSRLTEIMAGVVRARKLAGSSVRPSVAKAAAAATIANSGKGEEADGNGNSNQQRPDSSAGPAPKKGQ